MVKKWIEKQRIPSANIEDLKVNVTLIGGRKIGSVNCPTCSMAVKICYSSNKRFIILNFMEHYKRLHMKNCQTKTAKIRDYFGSSSQGSSNKNTDADIL